MRKMTQKDFGILFSGLCCSRCKNEFTINDLTEIRKENDIRICKLHCQKCDKDFGEVIINYNKKAKTHSPLEIIDGPAPIDFDDVIEAHKFIKENL
ncbi:MAG: hypothetical protein ACI37Q_04750 [Candidatus Gastranaerophilaceae bacterium]